MTEAVDLMQLSVQAAHALIGEMIKSSWENIRALAGRMFKRGGQETETRHLDMFDRDRAAISQAPADQRETLEKDLQQRWTIQIAAFLQQYPDAADDLRELLTMASTPADMGKAQATLTALNNVNSQVIQAGGDVSTGGGNISYERTTRSEE